MESYRPDRGALGRDRPGLGWPWKEQPTTAARWEATPPVVRIEGHPEWFPGWHTPGTPLILMRSDYESSDVA